MVAARTGVATFALVARSHDSSSDRIGTPSTEPSISSPSIASEVFFVIFSFGYAAFSLGWIAFCVGRFDLSLRRRAVFRMKSAEWM